MYDEFKKKEYKAFNQNSEVLGAYPQSISLPLLFHLKPLSYQHINWLILYNKLEITSRDNQLIIRVVLEN